MTARIVQTWADGKRETQAEDSQGGEGVVGCGEKGGLLYLLYRCYIYSIFFLYMVNKPLQTKCSNGVKTLNFPCGHTSSSNTFH